MNEVTRLEREVEAARAAGDAQRAKTLTAQLKNAQMEAAWADREAELSYPENRF